MRRRAAAAVAALVVVLLPLATALDVLRVVSAPTQVVAGSAFEVTVEALAYDPYGALGREASLNASQLRLPLSSGGGWTDAVRARVVAAPGVDAVCSTGHGVNDTAAVRYSVPGIFERGVATFTLALNATCTYVVEIASPRVARITTPPIRVVAGAPTGLRLAVQPGAERPRLAGTGPLLQLRPQPVLFLVDAGGNQVDTVNCTACNITATMVQPAAGPCTANATAAGGTTVALVHGVATFRTLALSAPCANAKLSFALRGNVSGIAVSWVVVSHAFVVGVGSPAGLAFPDNWPGVMQVAVPTWTAAATADPLAIAVVDEASLQVVEPPWDGGESTTTTLTSPWAVLVTIGRDPSAGAGRIRPLVTLTPALAPASGALLEVNASSLDGNASAALPLAASVLEVAPASDVVTMRTTLRVRAAAANSSALAAAVAALRAAAAAAIVPGGAVFAVDADSDFEDVFETFLSRRTVPRAVWRLAGAADSLEPQVDTTSAAWQSLAGEAERREQSPFFDNPTLDGDGAPPPTSTQQLLLTTCAVGTSSVPTAPSADTRNTLVEVVHSLAWAWRLVLANGTRVDVADDGTAATLFLADCLVAPANGGGGCMATAEVVQSAQLTSPWPARAANITSSRLRRLQPALLRPVIRGVATFPRELVMTTPGRWYSWRAHLINMTRLERLAGHLPLSHLLAFDVWACPSCLIATSLSRQFDVDVGPPSRLLVHTPAAGAWAGNQPFAVQPRVAVADRYGNVVAHSEGDTVRVSLLAPWDAALACGGAAANTTTPLPSSPLLTGALEAVTVGGFAAFSSLSITLASAEARLTWSLTFSVSPSSALGADVRPALQRGLVVAPSAEWWLAEETSVAAIAAGMLRYGEAPASLRPPATAFSLPLSPAASSNRSVTGGLRGDDTALPQAATQPDGVDLWLAPLATRLRYDCAETEGSNVIGSVGQHGDRFAHALALTPSLLAAGAPYDRHAVPQTLQIEASGAADEVVGEEQLVTLASDWRPQVQRLQLCVNGAGASNASAMAALTRTTFTVGWGGRISRPISAAFADQFLSVAISEDLLALAGGENGRGILGDVLIDREAVNASASACIAWRLTLTNVFGDTSALALTDIVPPNMTASLPWPVSAAVSVVERATQLGGTFRLAVPATWNATVDGGYGVRTVRAADTRAASDRPIPARVTRELRFNESLLAIADAVRDDLGFDGIVEVWEASVNYDADSSYGYAMGERSFRLRFPARAGAYDAPCLIPLAANLTGDNASVTVTTLVPGAAPISGTFSLLLRGAPGVEDGLALDLPVAATAQQLADAIAGTGIADVLRVSRTRLTQRHRHGWAWTLTLFPLPRRTAAAGSRPWTWLDAARLLNPAAGLELQGWDDPRGWAAMLRVALASRVSYGCSPTSYACFHPANQVLQDSSLANSSAANASLALLLGSGAGIAVRGGDTPCLAACALDAANCGNCRLSPAQLQPMAGSVHLFARGAAAGSEAAASWAQWTPVGRLTPQRAGDVDMDAAVELFGHAVAAVAVAASAGDATVDGGGGQLLPHDEPWFPVDGVAYPLRTPPRSPALGWMAGARAAAQLIVVGAPGARVPGTPSAWLLACSTPLLNATLFAQPPSPEVPRWIDFRLAHRDAATPWLPWNATLHQLQAALVLSFTAVRFATVLRDASTPAVPGASAGASVCVPGGTVNTTITWYEADGLDARTWQPPALETREASGAIAGATPMLTLSQIAIGGASAPHLDAANASRVFSSTNASLDGRGGTDGAGADTPSWRAADTVVGAVHLFQDDWPTPHANGSAAFPIWREIASLRPPWPAYRASSFGWAVAATAAGNNGTTTTVAVGAPTLLVGNASSCGGVLIYTALVRRPATSGGGGTTAPSPWTGTSSPQQLLCTEDYRFVPPAAGARFGWALAFAADGDTLAVGAPGWADGAGAVFVMKRQPVPTTSLFFVDQVLLSPFPGAGSSAAFGIAVAMSTQILAAAAPGAARAEAGSNVPAGIAVSGGVAVYSRPDWGSRGGYLHLDALLHMDASISSPPPETVHLSVAASDAAVVVGCHVDPLDSRPGDAFKTLYPAGSPAFNVQHLHFAPVLPAGATLPHYDGLQPLVRLSLRQAPLARPLHPAEGMMQSPPGRRVVWNESVDTTAPPRWARHTSRLLPLNASPQLLAAALTDDLDAGPVRVTTALPSDVADLTVARHSPTWAVTFTAMPAWLNAVTTPTLHAELIWCAVGPQPAVERGTNGTVRRGRPPAGAVDVAGQRVFVSPAQQGFASIAGVLTPLMCRSGGSDEFDAALDGGEPVLLRESSPSFAAIATTVDTTLIPFRFNVTAQRTQEPALPTVGRAYILRRAPLVNATLDAPVAWSRNWTIAAMLAPSVSQRADRYGFAVALTPDAAVAAVGAPTRTTRGAQGAAGAAFIHDVRYTHLRRVEPPPLPAVWGVFVDDASRPGGGSGGGGTTTTLINGSLVGGGVYVDIDDASARIIALSEAGTPAELRTPWTAAHLHNRSATFRWTLPLAMAGYVDPSCNGTGGQPSSLPWLSGCNVVSATAIASVSAPGNFWGKLTELGLVDAGATPAGLAASVPLLATDVPAERVCTRGLWASPWAGMQDHSVSAYIQLCALPVPPPGFNEAVCGCIGASPAADNRLLAVTTTLTAPSGNATNISSDSLQLTQRVVFLDDGVAVGPRRMNQWLELPGYYAYPGGSQWATFELSDDGDGHVTAGQAAGSMLQLAPVGTPTAEKLLAARRLAAAAPPVEIDEAGVGAVVATVTLLWDGAPPSEATLISVHGAPSSTVRARLGVAETAALATAWQRRFNTSGNASAGMDAAQAAGFGVVRGADGGWMAQCTRAGAVIVTLQRSGPAGGEGVVAPSQRIVLPPPFPAAGAAGAWWTPERGCARNGAQLGTAVAVVAIPASASSANRSTLVVTATAPGAAAVAVFMCSILSAAENAPVGNDSVTWVAVDAPPGAAATTALACTAAGSAASWLVLDVAALEPSAIAMRAALPSLAQRRLPTADGRFGPAGALAFVGEPDTAAASVTLLVGSPGTDSVVVLRGGDLTALATRHNASVSLAAPAAWWNATAVLSPRLRRLGGNGRLMTSEEAARGAGSWRFGAAIAVAGDTVAVGAPDYSADNADSPDGQSMAGSIRGSSTGAAFLLQHVAGATTDDVLRTPSKGRGWTEAAGWMAADAYIATSAAVSAAAGDAARGGVLDAVTDDASGEGMWVWGTTLVPPDSPYPCHQLDDGTRPSAACNGSQRPATAHSFGSALAFGGTGGDVLAVGSPQSAPAPPIDWTFEDGAAMSGWADVVGDAFKLQPFYCNGTCRGWRGSGRFLLSSARRSSRIVAVVAPGYPSAAIGAPTDAALTILETSSRVDAAFDASRTGHIVSAPFIIGGTAMTLLVAGGCDPQREYVALVVDGVIVRRATGTCSYEPRRVAWDVRSLAGRSARVVVADEASAQPFDWIEVDEITLDWPYLLHRPHTGHVFLYHRVALPLAAAGTTVAASLDAGTVVPVYADELLTSSVAAEGSNFAPSPVAPVAPLVAVSTRSIPLWASPLAAAALSPTASDEPGVVNAGTPWWQTRRANGTNALVPSRQWLRTASIHQLVLAPPCMNRDGSTAGVGLPRSPLSCAWIAGGSVAPAAGLVDAESGFGFGSSVAINAATGALAVGVWASPFAARSSQLGPAHRPWVAGADNSGAAEPALPGAAAPTAQSLVTLFAAAPTGFAGGGEMVRGWTVDPLRAIGLGPSTGQDALLTSAVGLVVTHFPGCVATAIRGDGTLPPAAPRSQRLATRLGGAAGSLCLPGGGPSWADFLIVGLPAASTADDTRAQTAARLLALDLAPLALSFRAEDATAAGVQAARVDAAAGPWQVIDLSHTAARPTAADGPLPARIAAAATAAKRALDGNVYVPRWLYLLSFSRTDAATGGRATLPLQRAVRAAVGDLRVRASPARPLAVAFRTIDATAMGVASRGVYDACVERERDRLRRAYVLEASALDVERLTADEVVRLVPRGCGDYVAASGVVTVTDEQDRGDIVVELLPHSGVCGGTGGGEAVRALPIFLVELQLIGGVRILGGSLSGYTVAVAIDC